MTHKLGALDEVMTKARDIAAIYDDGGGLSGYGGDAPGVMELCRLAALLEFQRDEARAEATMAAALLKEGLCTEDGEPVPLTVDSEEDRSVGIPFHAWLELPAGFEVVRVSSPPATTALDQIGDKS